MIDPVAAYDLLAPRYRAISDERHAYLQAVDNLIAQSVPRPVGSFLDAGAGDGVRGLALATRVKARQVTLLEPSAAMRFKWPSAVTQWNARLEQIGATGRQFDVIVCLWNVLGHIRDRPQAMTNLQRMLAPEGVLFLDVSNRYNAQHYGWFRTAGRWLGDRMRPSDSNGDVIARWSGIETYGHVFTPGEMARLIAGAGLTIDQRWVVDYRTGEIRRSPYLGHLLYQLRQ